MQKLKRILVFSGAGIGVPLGLPVSTGFNEGIEDGRRPITQHVADYLGLPASEDIEWILATLETFGSEVAFTEHLLPQFTRGNQYAEAGHESIKGRVASMKKDALAEITRLKQLVFRRLSAANMDQASELYRNLFQAIRNTWKEVSVSIFTTNYDLTFETAIEKHGPNLLGKPINDIDFGFKNRFGRPVYDPTATFDWTESVVEYLKLHGSLDWHRDGQGRCGRSMSNTVPDDPDQMAILYPGFKRVPSSEPFISLHGRLNRRLNEADLVIVIGFAFRDSYINSLFENAISYRNDLMVGYINPLSLQNHPEESIAPRLASMYSAQFKHLEERFEPDAGAIGKVALLLESTLSY